MKKHRIWTAFLAVSIVTGAIGFSLLIVEISLIFLVEPRIDYLHKDLVISLDEKLLYKIKPNCRSDINDWGYRDYGFSELIGKKTEKRIVVLGDSFVFGNNVSSEQTFTKRLEQELGSYYRCLNLGILGYGPDQSLLALIDKGFRLLPDQVVLTVFAANDFNDLKKNKLFKLDSTENLTLNRRNVLTEALPVFHVKLVLDKVLHRGFFEDASISKFFRRALYDSYDLLLGHRRETQVKIRLMNKLLQKYRDICAEKDIEFMVLIVPSYENIQNPRYFLEQNIPTQYWFLNEDAVRSICEDLRIPYLDLRDIFNRNKRIMVYDPDDHHFSEAGNQLVAESLKQALFRTHFE